MSDIHKAKVELLEAKIEALEIQLRVARAEGHRLRTGLMEILGSTKATLDAANGTKESLKNVKCILTVTKVVKGDIHNGTN